MEAVVFDALILKMEFLTVYMEDVQLFVILDLEIVLILLDAM